MKALNTIKKIAAVGIGVAMLGATAMGGMAVTNTLGQYPQPFTGGNTYIVLGSGNGAAITDVIGALNLEAALSGGSGSSGQVTFQTPESVVVGAQPLYQNFGQGGTQVFPVQGQYAPAETLTTNNMQVTNFLQSNGNSDLTEKFYINYTPAIYSGQNCPTSKVIDVKTFTYIYNYSNSNIDNYLLPNSDFKYAINFLGSSYNVYAPKANYTALKGNNVISSTSQNSNTLSLQRGGNLILVNSNQVLDLSSYGYPGYYMQIGSIMGGSSSSMTMQLMKGDNVNSLTAIGSAQPFSMTSNSYTFMDPNNNNVNVQVTLNNIGQLSTNTTGTQFGAQISFTSGSVKPGDYLDQNTKLWKLNSIRLNDNTGNIVINTSFEGATTSQAQNQYNCELYNHYIYLGKNLDLMGKYALSYTNLTTPATSPLSLSYQADNHRVVMTNAGGNGYFEVSGVKYKSLTLQLFYNKTSDLLQAANTTYYGATDMNGNSYTVISTGNKPAFINQLYNSNVAYFHPDSSANSGYFKIDTTQTPNPSLLLVSQSGSIPEPSVTDRIQLDASNSTTTSGDSYPGDVGFGTMTGLLESGLQQGGLIGAGKTTYYGIKVNQYDASNIQLSIPNDAVRSQVYLGGSSVTSQKSTVSYSAGDTLSSAIPAGSVLQSVGGNPIKVGIAELDTTALAADSQLSMNNYIVVGGPCINQAAAMLLKGDKQQYCGNESGIAPGTALVQLFTKGDHTALLVAGYSATQTSLASQMLAGNPSQFGDKTAAVVTGTTTSDASIN